MDYLISRNSDAPAISPSIARIGVTRMVGIEVVRLRAQVAIHLNAHANRVALRCLRHIVIDQIIRLKHLQRKWHAAAAKWLPDHPDEHLARFRHAAHQQALHVVEAQQTADIAAAFMHPPLPRLMHLPVNRLI